MVLTHGCCRTFCWGSQGDPGTRGAACTPRHLSRSCTSAMTVSTMKTGWCLVHSSMQRAPPGTRKKKTAPFSRHPTEPGETRPTILKAIFITCQASSLGVLTQDTTLRCHGQGVAGVVGMSEALGMPGMMRITGLGVVSMRNIAGKASSIITREAYVFLGDPPMGSRSAGW